MASNPSPRATDAILLPPASRFTAVQIPSTEVAGAGGKAWPSDQIARAAALAVRRFEAVDILRANLRRAEQELEAAVRVYSYAHGYCVPLRAEALRREIGA